MNNTVVQGFYNSIKQLINQEEQPNLNDNYTCFCGGIIQIEPFETIFAHITGCKAYKSESTFYKQFEKINIKILRPSHLLALKAEFLMIISSIDDFLQKKIARSPQPRQSQLQIKDAQQKEVQSQFKQKYSEKIKKVMQKQQSIKGHGGCLSCGKKGDSSIEIDCLQTLSACSHNYCLGCLRKQINSQYFTKNGQIACPNCKKQILEKELEQFIGHERVTYLQTKLKTGESPSQSTIHCAYCYRYIKPKQQDKTKREVCATKECAEKCALSCQKQLPCKHLCFGYRDEKQCLPCLICKLRLVDDYCNVCYTETYQEAPCIQAKCGHIFHYQCMLTRLEKRWTTLYISFGFCLCPLCKRWLEFPQDSKLYQKMLEFKELQGKVKMQAQLRVGKIDECQILDADQAMDVLAFYECCKCKSPYFGGKKDCQLGLEELEQAPQELVELICPSCCGIIQKGCTIHGFEYLEYKCRFCCNIATYFCWGTTHFCQECHKRQSSGQYISQVAREQLPKCLGKGSCPSGGNHGLNGEELCLGCGNGCGYDRTLQIEMKVMCQINLISSLLHKPLEQFGNIQFLLR